MVRVSWQRNFQKKIDGDIELMEIIPRRLKRKNRLKNMVKYILIKEENLEGKKVQDKEKENRKQKERKTEMKKGPKLMKKKGYSKRKKESLQ